MMVKLIEYNYQHAEQIKQYEGLKLYCYDDATGKQLKPNEEPKGCATIGYGHKLSKSEGYYKYFTITKEFADQLFKYDLRTKAIQPLKDWQIDKGVQLDLNQFSALVSFIFNIGIGNFRKSKLARLICARPIHPYSYDDSIEKEFKKWRKSKGVILPGLVARRAKESELYFS